jgi:hypothetical protein
MIRFLNPECLGLFASLPVLALGPGCKAEGFRFIFELAAEVTYIGRAFPSADLQKWSKIVNAELTRLEVV